MAFRTVRPLGTAPLGGDLPGPPVGTTDNYQLRIGPYPDAINYVAYQSFRVSEQLNGRNTASFKLFIRDGFQPLRGHEVLLTLTEGGTLTRLFNGFLFSRAARHLSKNLNTGVIEMDVECVDWNALADRRLIGEIYLNQTLGAIVRDVVAQTLVQEGVSDAGVQDGPMIEKVVFPNITVAEAFDLLSEATGYYWDIDYHKVLHFFERATELAPFALTVGANAILTNFEDQETLAQYRNSQLVGGGKGTTEPRNESFRGDLIQ